MATSATTRDIPRNQWEQFFDTFSKNHRDCRVTIEVMGRDVGDQAEATNAPFDGITYIDAGTGAGRIEVITGDRPNDHGGHVVDRPRAVRVADTDRGAEADIEIQDESGITMLVHVRR